MANQPRPTNRTIRLTLGRQLASLAAMMFLIAAGARAQQTNAAALAAIAQGTPAPAQAGAPPEGTGTHTLHLLVGRSLVISSPTPIKRVSVADPTIADAVVISPYQVLLNGKAPGGVSFLLWDEMDQSQTFEVSVDIDILSLNEKIHEVFPSEADSTGNLQRRRDAFGKDLLGARGGTDPRHREGLYPKSDQPDDVSPGGP